MVFPMFFANVAQGFTWFSQWFLPYFIIFEDVLPKVLPWFTQSTISSSISFQHHTFRKLIVLERIWNSRKKHHLNGNTFENPIFYLLYFRMSIVSRLYPQNEIYLHNYSRFIRKTRELNQESSRIFGRFNGSNQQEFTVFSDHISAIKCWNIWDGREINTGELNRN
jgi:hypothetical protein